jgi:hypothetical protein
MRGPGTARYLRPVAKLAVTMGRVLGDAEAAADTRICVAARYGTKSASQDATGQRALRMPPPEAIQTARPAGHRSAALCSAVPPDDLAHDLRRTTVVCCPAYFVRLLHHHRAPSLRMSTLGRLTLRLIVIGCRAGRGRPGLR